MQDFRQLLVWEKSHHLVVTIYKVTAGFPPDERFGLTNQLRRAAVSIPSNIAEGCGRGSDPDFARFVQMALGSASEVEYQLLLAKDLMYLPSTDHAVLTQAVTEIKRMLSSFLQTLRTGS